MLAALAAGELGKQTAMPVYAGTDGDVVLGAINYASKITTIHSADIQFPNLAIFQVDARPNTGTAGITGIEAFGSHGGAGLGAVGGDRAGTGVRAFGGQSGTAGGGGTGVVASGGSASTAAAAGGIGVDATGGSSGGTAPGGIGVRGNGGGSIGSQASGVV